MSLVRRPLIWCLMGRSGEEYEGAGGSPPALSLLNPRALAQGLWSARALNCLSDPTAKPTDALRGLHSVAKWSPHFVILAHRCRIIVITVFGRV